MGRIGMLSGVFGLTVVGSLAVIPAHAVELTRQDFQGAVGMCKGATPAYSAGLRNRPLGMANESGATVFVTCNWQGDDSQNTVRGARRLTVVFGNSSASTKNVACTLVNGFQSGSQTVASYTPKTVSVAAGGSATIQWLPAEVSGAPAQIALPALSCSLPAGTVLQYTSKQYNEDVGA